MKALVGAFNQEKALVGAFSVIVQPVVELMEHYTDTAKLSRSISPPQHRVEILELLEAVEVAGSAPEAAKGPPQHLGLGLGGGRVRAGEVLLGEALPGQSCNTRGFEI